MEAISKLEISMGSRASGAIVSSLVGLVWLVGGMSGATRGSECVACPFCSAASQTLRQESLSMDAVAIASLVSDGRLDIDGNATFVIERTLRGDSLLEKGQKVEASYFGPGKTEKKFLLLGVDPRNLVWSSPLPLTEDAVKYVESIQTLPDDPIARLEFYQKHFEHPDSLLARDSYDEFALAPYEDVKNLKSKMNREQLMDWIRDPQISPDRKRLYFTMMGICGTDEDAVEFETMIRSEDPDKHAGLDALIAAYLMLRGSDGLKLIDEQFLTNRKASYPDVYSSVMALRFHGTESDVIPKDAILKSMRHLIEAPDLADLVIPDLARWGDWSQVDRLTELFKTSNDDNSWVRVPVVNYLRACPLPEAKERLKELELIDPKAVKRAATFFPIPSPAPQPAKKEDNSSSSSWHPDLPAGGGGASKLQPLDAKRLTAQAIQGWSLETGALAGWSLWESDAIRGWSVSGRSASGAGMMALRVEGSVYGRPHSRSERGDKVFAMNSLTLLAVIACGGIAFGAAMGMIAGGLLSGECVILRWLLVPRR